MMASEIDISQQLVQRAFEECSYRFNNEKVKRQVLGMLIHNGGLTLEDIKEAIEISERIEKEEKMKAEKRAKEQEEHQKQREKPDSKIPVLWQSVRVQPERLTKYLATYDLDALEAYLSDMKARPLHYHSIFHGQITEAIRFIDQALANRKTKTNSKTKKSEEPKAPTPTPEYAT